MTSVPAVRLRPCNSAPVRAAGRYVLYWMIAARRLHHNFALDRAVELANELKKPLLIFEAIRCDHRWASDRIHSFVFQGMADNAATAAKRAILYYPYVEPAPGAGKGLLAALAADASCVVTDDFPCFFLPLMVAAAAKKLPVRLEAVDSNGLLPLRASPSAFSTAYSFRRFLQKVLPAHLFSFPAADPLVAAPRLTAPNLPKALTARWTAADPRLLRDDGCLLAQLPIDHRVAPTNAPAGHSNAHRRMRQFLDRKLERYSEHRHKPELDATSGFSPCLHFGHLSAHEVFSALTHHEKWSHEKLALRATGSREGWWNMSPAAEAFLDEFVTWRELSYNFCTHRRDFDRYESLPPWAQQTLEKHSRDQRTHLYAAERFEKAQTHDPLWNASQTQLVREGRIHSYLRMLWGKKILEWSRTPQLAVETMVHLNNKFALDGRDPNSYSGIFWTLGRYDRPWGPERPVFGSVRYMSSANTARKVSIKNYIRTYSPDSASQATPGI